MSILEEHLQRALQGPFHHPEFDSDTGLGTVYRTESTTSGLFSLPLQTSQLGLENYYCSLPSEESGKREREREF